MSQYGLKIPAEQAKEVLAAVLTACAETWGIRPEAPRLDRRIEVAGSLRRGKPVVGDLDLVAAGDDHAWVETVELALVKVAGEERCFRTKAGKLTGVLVKGIPVELNVARPGAYGSQLLHSTGSKEHNIAMRALAMKKGMLLSNHGLFRAAVDPRGKRVPGELIAAAEEADIFVALGMKYVEPEARE